MSRKLSFELRLRDQLIMADVTLDPPDASVGIMGWAIDDYTLHDQDGREVAWELSDQEIDILYNAMPEPADYESDYPQEEDE